MIMFLLMMAVYESYDIHVGAGCNDDNGNGDDVNDTGHDDSDNERCVYDNYEDAPAYAGGDGDGDCGDAGGDGFLVFVQARGGIPYRAIMDLCGGTGESFQIKVLAQQKRHVVILELDVTPRQIRSSGDSRRHVMSHRLVIFESSLSHFCKRCTSGRFAHQDATLCS